MALSLTRKTDYALVTLAALAAAGARGEALLSARDIAEAHRLPLPLLMNLLKELARAGIVGARRGVAGGYFLKKEPARIALLNVIEALEGKVHLAACCDIRDGVAGVACRAGGGCLIMGPLQRFNVRMRTFLSTLTLADLLGQSGANDLNGGKL